MRYLRSFYVQHTYFDLLCFEPNFPKWAEIRNIEVDLFHMVTVFAKQQPDLAKNNK